MKTGILIALLLLPLLAVPASAAQADNGIHVLALDNGVMLVWNQPNNHFTLEIHGKRVVPIPDARHVFFDVDGAILQIQSVPVSAFLPDPKGKDDIAILEAHRDWETSFIREALKIESEFPSTKKTTAGGGAALAWSCAMPPDIHSDASEQLYLSVLRKDRVILLNGAVRSGTNRAAVEKMLEDCLSTLQVSEKSINVKKLQGKIRKGG